MIETRAIIKDIEKTKEILNNLNAKFKNNYAFKDIIFVPKEEKYNLNEDFLRLRIYTINKWSTKNIILVRKKTKWKNKYKISTVVLKEEFDTEKEAFDFIQKKLKGFINKFEYSRVGWEYDLKNCHLFLEDISNYGPSIEIETENENELEEIFNKIGIIKKVKDSMPEVMHKILTKT